MVPLMSQPKPCISKTRRVKLRSILYKLKYHPAELTIDDAFERVLAIMETQPCVHQATMKN